VPLLVAAICLALGGCFVSEQPRLTLRTATAALGEGGRYEVFERQTGGSYRHQEFFTVRHLADGSYEFVNEKAETLPISFHRLADGLFVGQARPNKSRPGYGYIVVRMTAGEVLIYAPQCDSQDQARLVAYGVTLRDRYNCAIDGVAEPLELFATLKLGEPVSKMVRQAS
jgi:hypothetical protein